jgi:hypothetical protein
MRTCSQKNTGENLGRTEAGFHPECEATYITWTLRAPWLSIARPERMTKPDRSHSFRPRLLTLQSRRRPIENPARLLVRGQKIVDLLMPMSPLVALFGSAVVSAIDPECTSKRTSIDRSEFRMPVGGNIVRPHSWLSDLKLFAMSTAMEFAFTE